MSYSHKNKQHLSAVVVRNAVWAGALLIVSYGIVLCMYHALMAMLYENNLALAGMTLCEIVLLASYYKLIRMIE